MKVAVVGHTSMLGKRLIEILAGSGIDVIKCGRDNDSDIKLDLLEGFRIDSLEGIQVDALFHCAASFADNNWDGCRKNDLTNAFGCYWIAELADKLQCRQVIYSGSLFSLPETDSEGMSSYGFSKARGEDILEWALSRNNILFASLRFPQIYDENGECCHHQPWFGRIVAYAAAGKDLHMPKSLGPRNFIHVSDAAQMLLAAFRQEIHGRINISHPESLYYEQIASLAYGIFGKGGSIRTAENKTPFRKIFFPSGEAAFGSLGYRPQISMSTGLSLINKLDNAGNFGPMDVE